MDFALLPRDLDVSRGEGGACGGARRWLEGDLGDIGGATAEVGENGESFHLSIPRGNPPILDGPTPAKLILDKDPDTKSLCWETASFNSLTSRCNDLIISAWE